MPILARLSEWWKTRRPKPLDQLLSVVFDDEEVRVVAHGQMDAKWNQSFRWEDIERVCFTDEGLYSSDRISVELKAGQTPVVVLTEAIGGTEFFGAITERGYFPEEVWRRVMGEAGGATVCWPPRPSSG
ncbi:MAG: hypothetical protein V4582_23065 [Pseudomonadota bacterium]